jgi:HEPN domain-containing protein
MRPEVEWWLKQSRADFIAAKHSMAAKDFHVSVFMVHQSVEKSLKALFIFKFNSLNFKTHNLIQLGKELAVKPKFLTFLAKLSPEYALSRYPDASYGVPAERYTEELASEFLIQAEEVLKWAESQIGK